MGVTLAGGQGELRGKIVRIGHIGYVDIFDIVTGLAAIELALAEAGADIERGAGPAARSRRSSSSARLSANGRPRVLVRETIAARGVELLRERFDVDEDSTSDLAEASTATTRSSSARRRSSTRRADRAGATG